MMTERQYDAKHARLSRQLDRLTDAGNAQPEELAATYRALDALDAQWHAEHSKNEHGRLPTTNARGGLKWTKDGGRR